MQLLGILSILLTFLSIPLAARNAPRRDVVFLVAVALAHIVASYVFYRYALTFGADSELYYFDEYGFYQVWDFRFGTAFVLFAVQWAKETFGGSYLDYFLVFQTIGFIGIIFLYLLVKDIYEEFGDRFDFLAYFVFFLPTLQFWTNSIGKDATLFTGVVLTFWAAYKIRTRYVMGIVGLGMTLLVRPYITLAAALAVAIAVLLSRRTSLVLRIVLFLGCLSGVALLIDTVQGTYNFNISSAEGVEDFFATQGEVHQNATEYNVVTGSYLFRLYSLLLRPFFLDAAGFFGVAVSIENVFYLFVYGSIIINAKWVVAAVRISGFVRYMTIFSLIIMLLLAGTYFNIGLGLRQRVMFLPGFLCLLLIVRLMRKAHREALHQDVLAMPTAGAPTRGNFQTQAQGLEARP